MEETVNVILPLPQGIWRGCCSRRVAKQLPSRRQRSAVRSLWGALDGRPDSCRCAARTAADGGCSTGTVAPGAGMQEVCCVEDATPSVISTSSTRTMETSKR